jgi:hypothetical protein
MHRRAWGLAVAAITTLAVTASIFAAPGGAEPSGQHAFQVAIRFGDDPLIDVGGSPPGPDVGDIVALDDQLLVNGRVIGHDGGSCVFNNVSRPEASCVVTFALPRGTITGQWLNQPPPRKVVAVTGGTGLYRNARGEAVIVEAPDQTGTATFRLIGSPNRL